jgi:hypothetical protein
MSVLEGSTGCFLCSVSATPASAPPPMTACDRAMAPFTPAAKRSSSSSASATVRLLLALACKVALLQGSPAADGQVRQYCQDMPLLQG